MEQKNKIRITQLAKELGVGVGTLIDFFSKEVQPALNANSKIDDDLYKKALKRFGNDKILQKKVEEQIEKEQLNQKNVIVVEDNRAQLHTENQQTKNDNSDKSQNNIEQIQNKKEVVPELKKEENSTIEQENNEVGVKVLGKIDPNLLHSNNKYKGSKHKKQEIKEEKKEQKKEDVTEKIEKKDIEKKEELETETKITKKEIIKEEIEPAKEEISAQKNTEEFEENIEEIEDIEDLEENTEVIAVPTIEGTTDSEVGLYSGVKLEGPKVLGKLDLNSMNLRTRPDKKTKKEKDQERKKFIEQRKIKKSKFIKEQEAKKDPNNLQKKVGVDPLKKPVKKAEKVDIKDEKKYVDFKKKKKKTPVEPELTNEQDIQKQVKETLQKIEQRKKSDTVKFHREKRKLNDQKIKRKAAAEEEESKIIKVSELITVKELASLLSVEPTDIIEFCFDMGQPVTINYRLDSDLINMISEEFGVTIEFVESSLEEEIENILKSKDNQKEERPPIVTVMGHVDHGKTSLLDYIRKTNVVGGESGGITQHIGAYSVEVSNKIITFIDTPGHEAFTAMRARGTKITDIAVIVIAADDSIMPQTEEAIDHAKAAGVSMIFAINKVDKNGADPEKIKKQLAERSLLIEEWGGKFGCVEISAKKGLNVDKLLERIALEAELMELKANPKASAILTVLEARLDKGRGYITNAIVRNGTLRIGDIIVSGGNFGRIKALLNDKNEKIKDAGPSRPIQILGLNGAPEPGEPIMQMDNEREAREKAEQRMQIIRELEMRARKKQSLEEISKLLAKGEKTNINFIVKADVKGSCDAIAAQVGQIGHEEVKVNVIRSAVGEISESDVLLATASDAIVIGFNVRPSMQARKLAETKSIEIRLYSIIYDIINDVKDAVVGLLKPEYKEEITGSAEVMEVFKVEKVGTVAGCIVRDGKITRDSKARLIRDGIVVFTSKLSSLKRFKDDAKEVSKGYECGISLENFNDIKQGDFIEVFKEIEVERTL